MEVTVNRRKWGIISLTGTVGFFFAIAPVLDPYIVIEIGSGFTLKINDVIMLFLTMLCFSKSYRFERKTGFLCIWLLGLGLIGIILKNCLKIQMHIMRWLKPAIHMVMVMRARELLIFLKEKNIMSGMSKIIRM